jgi:hypothetical protein
MKAIGLFAMIPFVIGWTIAIGSWFYAAYHFIRGWRDSEHRRKVRLGAIGFFAGWLLAAASGTVTWLWLGASGCFR